MRPSGDIELEHYLAISRAVAGELDFQRVLDRVAGAVKHKLVQYDHMDVLAFLPSDKSMHISIETGMKTLWSNNQTYRHNSLSPVRQLLTGEVAYLLTGDAWEDPRFHFDGAVDSPIFEANLRSRIHVPMHVHGEMLGALNISSHEKNAYDMQDIEIARNISDLIAPYMYALSMGEQARISALAEGAARGREQSLRIGAQKLTDAMEAERRRLGMELHDQTLADLSAIYRHVAHLANEKHPDARDLKTVSEAISRCTGELRGIIENAKPGVLDLFGLSQAIEAQLKRSTQGVGRTISTSLFDETDDLLDQVADHVRLAIFRIVQEAVTNAVKHSECSLISVGITRDGEQAVITVENDGKEPAEGWRRSSRGVDNIRVRAQLIGAEVAFHRNESGEGSQTILMVPLEIMNGHQTAPNDPDLSVSEFEQSVASPSVSQMKDPT